MGAVEFQNNSALAPFIASISPTSGVKGATFTATITGTNLTGASLINGLLPGVSYTILTSSSTQITATIAIGSTAGAGVRNVSVTTPTGTSNTVVFNVLGPTLSGISPNSGVRGTNVPVTITGTGLTGATAVTVSGTGVTASGVAANAAGTSVTATLNIANGASGGARSVTVTSPQGTTPVAGAPTFTVNGATVSFTYPTLITSPATLVTKTGFVTVSNASTATAPLTMTAAPTIASVTGTGVFSIIAGGTCSSTSVIAPGGSCTINVQYAPGASAGASTATVTITGTGMATPTMTSAAFSAN